MRISCHVIDLVVAEMKIRLGDLGSPRPNGDGEKYIQISSPSRIRLGPLGVPVTCRSRDGIHATLMDVIPLPLPVEIHSLRYPPIGAIGLGISVPDGRPCK